MKWAKVSIAGKKAETDVIASFFDDIGSNGVEIDDPSLSPEEWAVVDWAVPPEKKPVAEDDPTVTVTAYFANDAYLDETLAKLRDEISAFAERTGLPYSADDVKCEIVDDNDWADNWKEFFHTTKVGDKVVIQPAWEDYEPGAGEVVVKLDPGAAFGTGTHATTALCIRALESAVRPGMRVFDVGTGSGVLAVTAAKLGAGEVVAMDYDSAAEKAARENAERNGVGSIVKTGVSDLLAAYEGQADLVVANIIADIVIRLLEDVDDSLADGGRVLLSGIIKERVKDVRQKAVEKGFRLLRLYESKGWAAMLFARADD